MRKPEVTNRQAVLDQFEDSLTRTWKSGEVSTYRSIRVADNINIVIEREPAFVNWAKLDEEDRAEAATDDRYAGPEFHVLNDEGGWAGPSATVYGPEVRWGDKITWSQVNHSTSGDKTPAATRAAAQMFMIAADYAEAWDLDAKDRVEAEQAEAAREREELRARQEAARVARQQERASFREALNGSQMIRLHLNDKKGAVVGEYVGLTDTGFVTVNVTYRDEPVRIKFDRINAAEAKLPNGKYTLAYAKKEA